MSKKTKNRQSPFLNLKVGTKTTLMFSVMTPTFKDSNLKLDVCPQLDQYIEKEKKIIFFSCLLVKVELKLRLDSR